MNKTVACGILACLPLAAGFAVHPTSAQDRTAQPGQPTQGKVWIQNRGDAESVPVTIQNMAHEAPTLRVQVIGTPTVTIGNASLQVRATRQPWEYRNVTVPSGQDPVTLLNAAGTDGWEVTGVAVPAPGGTLVVLKRPR